MALKRRSGSLPAVFSLPLLGKIPVDFQLAFSDRIEGTPVIVLFVSHAKISRFRCRKDAHTAGPKRRKSLEAMFVKNVPADACCLRCSPPEGFCSTIQIVQCLDDILTSPAFISQYQPIKESVASTHIYISHAQTEGNAIPVIIIKSLTILDRDPE
ncbi:hypothetical protein Tco_1522290 [Tanacetum coccineum]